MGALEDQLTLELVNAREDVEQQPSGRLFGCGVPSPRRAARQTNERPHPRLGFASEAWWIAGRADVRNGGQEPAGRRQALGLAALK